MYGDVLNPALSMTVFTGDLGMDTGDGQSVYLLDTERHPGAQGRRHTVPCGPRLGETAELPDGLGSVSFDDVQRWNKIQISRTPGKLIALCGVLLALSGLLGSLFIRPRRIWVRARRTATMPVTAHWSRWRDSTGPATATCPARWRWSPRPWGCASRLTTTPTKRTGDDRRGPGRPSPTRRSRSRGRSTSSPFSRTWSSGVRCARCRWAGRRARSRSPGCRCVALGVDAESADASTDEQTADRIAMFGRLGLLLTGSPSPCTSSGCSGAGWPRTPTGCPGATCTSSRSAGPSSSPSATSRWCAGSGGSGWRRSSWASC